MFNSTIFTCLHNNLHHHRHFNKYSAPKDGTYQYLFNKTEEDDDTEEDDLDIYDCIALGAIIGVILSVFLFIFI